MITLDDVVRELGYSESAENWLPADPVGHGHARPASQIPVEGVKGAYLFHTSSADPDGIPLPPQPAVCVAEACDAEDARRLHKSLWNLGTTPFLVIVLPDEVRVYTGFLYEEADAKRGIIKTLRNKTIGAIRNALAEFHAREIDSGRIWESQAKNLSLDTRVDRRLLRSLNDLGNELVHRKQLPPNTAHALIGKYIYICYLRQRKILSDKWLEARGLDFRRVLGRQATLDHLLDLSRALEARFNGGVFPLRSTEQLNDGIVSYVASVFCGEYQGQLALDFRAYDFSYIPVETLSLIYEQFLHRENKGKAAGAYYTPVPLADYLVAELNREMPLKPGMRVLDPCCGSGVFLVLAYRRLIELELDRSPNGSLTLYQLASILQHSIFGVELNLDACYVAEFSLILTLLSYVEPPDLHQNEEFQFPALHNTNIFECDFFNDTSAFWTSARRFDWIVGNPPWTLLDRKRKEDALALNWIGTANESGRSVSLNRLCDAFCWRVTDVLASGGHVGLVTHAKTLTNERCESFRRAFFQQMEIKRITNFSNLAYILFAGRAEAPAATMVYTAAQHEMEKQPIVHYGPFAINQVPARAVRKNDEGVWAITIYQNEIGCVSPSEAESGNAETWKMALWGSYRDKRAIARLDHLFTTTLGKLCARQGWSLEKGLQLRRAGSESTVSLSDLAGIRLLSTTAMNASKFRFSVPCHVLKDVNEDMLNVRERSGSAGKKIVYAPHIFVTSNFAAYGDTGFILPHGQIGISAPQQDAEHLRALSAVLNSSVLRYLLFFASSGWGADRSKVEKNEVRDLPVPVLSRDQISQLAVLHRDLAAEEERCAGGLFRDTGEICCAKVPETTRVALQSKCDAMVEQILGIPSSVSALISDFWQVRYGLNKGKRRKVNAAAVPSQAQLEKYAACLSKELDSFARAHHQVTIAQSRHFICCAVQFTRSKRPIQPQIAGATGKALQDEQGLWQQLRAEASQWVYVQRALKVFDGDSLYLYKAPRLLDWTVTQALLDSDDIIAEVLAQGGSRS